MVRKFMPYYDSKADKHKVLYIDEGEQTLYTELENLDDNSAAIRMAEVLNHYEARH